MTWTPISACDYDHNVNEIIITELNSGRRMETIVATH